jgi:hypothetical protein
LMNAAASCRASSSVMLPGSRYGIRSADHAGKRV